MKRTVLTCCMLTGLAAVAARAAEPAAQAQPKPKQEAPPQTPAELAEPEVPERKLVFEVSEEPYPSFLSAGRARDPKWLERRYVAIVRMTPPSLPPSVTGDSSPFSPHPYAPKVRGGVAYLYSYSFARETRVLRERRPLELRLWPQWKEGPWLQGMVSDMPKERQPSKEVVSELEATCVAQPWASGAETLLLYVFAPTAERAQELTPQLLDILDWGLWRPNRQKIQEMRQPEQERLAEARAAVSGAKEEIAKLEKELEKLQAFKDLDKEALSGLTTQQRLIDVDLAGVAAQIEACNRILKDSPELAAGVRSPRSEQVETLKITAEIELVGLTARKDAIDEIVTKGQARYELNRKVLALRSNLQRRESSIGMLERIVAVFEDIYRANMPFPVEGKIEIRPVKWEVAQEK